ncbi:MAG: apolipoprotein N-acyltransferase [Capnocytophaga sp.]|nr:apolipoprotein N-acyltransferase [Capnocytophaga sp.]
MSKNVLLAVISGLLLALSWPVYGFPIFLFVALVPLLIAEKRIRKQYRHTKRRVLMVSYLAFLIWNSITTWWIWYSTEIGMVFAILTNTLLMSITMLLYHFVAKRLPEKMALIFMIAIWLSFEKFHLTWDVSWPWLNLGNAFSEHIAWVQWYEYTGTFGGTLWVWLINITIFLGYENYIPVRQRRLLTPYVGLATLFFAVPIAISYVMYAKYTEKENPVSVVVLQPNIDPYTEKYHLSNKQIAELMISLSEPEMDEKVRYIIAPETVFADNIRLDELPVSMPVVMLRQWLGQYPDARLVSGVAMIDFLVNDNQRTPQSNYWRDGIWYNDYNSAFMLGSQTDIPLYHKSKLVVGVENFPYQNVLKPLLGETLINLGGTVALKTTQEERSVFAPDTHSGAAAPIICYESIYGEFVTGYVRNGADFLAILTNDAWWRDTQGHRQLLSYAKLRAVETRRSIARSANTGISAFINQRGDLISSLPYGEQGSLKETIQRNDKVTFYVRFGDYIARIGYFLSLFIFLFSFARKKEVISF